MEKQKSGNKLIIISHDKASFAGDSTPNRSEPEDLFDKYFEYFSHAKLSYRNSQGYLQDNTKSGSKNSFFDEVKKILKEGTQNDRKTPNTLSKQLSAGAKTLKPEASRPKKEPSNRPALDVVGGSAKDLRAKISREGRLLDDIKKSLKINTQNGSVIKDKDMKLITLDGGTPATKKPVQQKTNQPQKVWDQGRRRSEAINLGLETLGSHNGEDGSIVLEISTERRDRRPNYGTNSKSDCFKLVFNFFLGSNTANSINTVDSGNLKRGTDLVGKVVSGVRKVGPVNSTKGAMKDLNAKRKNTAGYPLN